MSVIFFFLSLKYLQIGCLITFSRNFLGISFSPFPAMNFDYCFDNFGLCSYIMQKKKKKEIN